MKVTVCYDVHFDFEVPDYIPEYIERIASEPCDEGKLWATLARTKCGFIDDMYQCVDDIEMIGVYNLENDDILWENN